MALRATKRSTNFGDGIFINEVTLATAVDHGAGIPANLLPDHPRFKNFQSGVELMLEFSFDTGHGFSKEIFMFGKKFVDDDGEPERKGTYFNLALLAQAIEYEGDITDDNLDINKEFLAAVAGSKVKVVDYATQLTKRGKVAYDTWELIFSIHDDDDYVRNQFLRQVERGYVRRYDPNLTSVSDNGVATVVVSNVEGVKVPF